MVGYPKEFYIMRKKLIKYPCKCDVCKNTFYDLMALHHIDGDINNNKRENLLKACSYKCHPLIHNAKTLKSKFRYLERYLDCNSIDLTTAHKIRAYRLKLLHRDNKFKEKNPPCVL